MIEPNLEKQLIEAMEEFDIIDCHEHLGPEANRVAMPVDVFTLFSHYTRGDLAVAGMSEAVYQSLFNQDIPLERRWRIFAPYWEHIRWTSYSRAALIAAEKFFGYDDINEDTYGPISEAIKEHNTPGLYDRVLGQACKAQAVLTQCRSTRLDSPLLVPLMPLSYEMETWEALSRPVFNREATIRSLDDYVDEARKYIVQVKQEGAVGLKMVSNPYQEPDRSAALAAFDSLRTGTETRLPELHPLRDYVIDRLIAFAVEQDMTIAVHTGYWGDFRKLDPLHMIPLLQRHPDARFDIYHLGYPWMREALMLGKGFPNVWLDLAWTHVISQEFAVTGIDEAIDLVPTNKILAFGGDYGIPVEKAYGHLVMARENIARVLARRIERGQMTGEQAIEIAHKWFWDNPKELYDLDV